MLKRARVNAQSRAFLVGAILTLGAVASVPAFAVPGAPSVTIGGATDGYINAAEWNAGITVSGEAAAGVNLVEVRVVNSAVCDPDAAETTAMKVATLTAGATSTAYTVTFSGTELNRLGSADASDDVLSEGARVCARVRASDNAGSTYGILGVPSVIPTKDTIAPVVGTVDLADPDGTGYMNATEAAGELIGVRWTGAADAAEANLSIASLPLAAPAACVFAAQAPTDNTSLSTACSSALDNNKTFTLNGSWTDVAGNVSATASDSLIKDITAPAAPTALILDDPIRAFNQEAVDVCGISEKGSDVTVTLASGGVSAVGSTTADSTAACGAATPGASERSYSVAINASSLPDGTATATAIASDAAKNVSLPGTDTVVKDATAPAKPTVAIFPKNITKDTVASVELSIGGESGTVGTAFITDHTGRQIAPNGLNPFPVNSDVTVRFNVSELADGPLTATVVLKDSVGNESPLGTATANKDAFKPLVRITSPASNQLTQGAVKIQGTGDAIVAGGEVEVFEGATSLGKAKILPSGRWELEVTYTRSGTRLIRARATKDSSGATLGFHPSGSLAASEFTDDLRFDVDAVRPIATSTSPLGNVYLPGEQIVLEGDAKDDYSGVLAVELHVYDLRGVDTRNMNDPKSWTVGKEVLPVRNATCTGCGTKAASWKANLSHLPSGSYYVQAIAIDNAANRQADPTILTFVKL